MVVYHVFAFSSNRLIFNFTKPEKVVLKSKKDELKSKKVKENRLFTVLVFCSLFKKMEQNLIFIKY